LPPLEKLSRKSLLIQRGENMMLRKMSFLALGIFTLAFIFLLTDTAEARRMGGGKSFGSSPSYQRSAPSPQRSTNQTAQSQPSKQGQAAPAAPASPFGRFGGMLGGFLMGGLLGSLLFGGMNGFGGPGLLDILIVGGLLFFLFRFLRARRMATASAGSSAFSSTPFQDVQPREGWGTSGYGQAPQPIPSSFEPSAVPAGFDQKEFLKGAKAAYTRLQQSWDKRDLNDIREFTSPEVFQEIRRQAEEDPKPGRTEIVLVNANLMEVKSDGGQTVASVLYDVLMRESADETMSKQVREIWHFREKAPGSSWTLEGIQQVED
jgi:predicted lipid-binding transport protein (Tim44 family)